MDRSTLTRLFAAPELEAVDCVLVGGVALNLHGIARATEDVDLFVRPDEVNVARLRSALRRLVDDPDIEGIEAADLAGPSSATRRRTAG